MSYIDSKYIKVYPSAYRSYTTSGGVAYDPESKLPTENNIISQTNNIVQSLTDGIDSYIISTEFTDNQKLTDLSNSDIVKFIIHGYKFEVQAQALKALTSPIYAKIVLKDANTNLGDNTDYRDTHLSPISDSDVDLDSATSQFLGMDFVSTKPTSGFYLQLTKSDGTFNSDAYLSNMLKLGSVQIDALDATTIEGGTINADNLVTTSITTNNATVRGALNTSGPTNVGNVLTVYGTTNLNGPKTNVTTLEASVGITTKALTATNAITTKSLSVTDSSMSVGGKTAISMTDNQLSFNGRANNASGLSLVAHSWPKGTKLSRSAFSYNTLYSFYVVIKVQQSGTSIDDYITANLGTAFIYVDQDISEQAVARTYLTGLFASNNAYSNLLLEIEYDPNITSNNASYKLYIKSETSLAYTEYTGAYTLYYSSLGN